MTNPFPEDVSGPDKSLYFSLRDQVKWFADEILNVLVQLSTGEFGDLKELPKLKRDLQSAAKHFRDLECDIARVERKHREKTNVPELDLDAIRVDIGRRLDRLRVASDPGSISE